MLQFPRWKVDVKVGGDVVKTLYETATTPDAAIAKAKRKLRGAVSSAGAFRFTATKVDATSHHATKYGKKAQEKIERTMHEWKRGTLRTPAGKKVTSREQAVAIGLSQARRAGYKVPPAPSHSTMWKPGPSLDEKVRARLSHMRPGTEIDAYGMARELREDPLGVGYALQRAVKDGYAVTEDGRWFGPASSAVSHARKKSPAQLDREIADALSGHGGRSRGGRAHATKKTALDANLFAVEIDRSEFDDHRGLPDGARWRDDLVHLAEGELARGRTYRRPKDARYAVVEWTGYRAGIGRLLDWLEATPGVTRYAEIFEA